MHIVGRHRPTQLSIVSTGTTFYKTSSPSENPPLLGLSTDKMSKGHYYWKDVSFFRALSRRKKQPFYCVAGMYETFFVILTLLRWKLLTGSGKYLK